MNWVPNELGNLEEQKFYFLSISLSKFQHSISPRGPTNKRAVVLFSSHLWTWPHNCDYISSSYCLSTQKRRSVSLWLMYHELIRIEGPSIPNPKPRIFFLMLPQRRKGLANSIKIYLILRFMSYVRCYCLLSLLIMVNFY